MLTMPSPYPFVGEASGGTLLLLTAHVQVIANAVILDVDGTLVDTNYQHAIAWHRALRDHGYTVQLWRIHRHIGMGGDQIVGALIGDEEPSATAMRFAKRRARPTGS